MRSTKKFGQIIIKPSMLVAFSFLTFFWSTTLLAELPIRKHLIDATKINIKRSSAYAELTSNKSLPLSNELIAMENLALVITFSLDLRAKVYLKHGIGVFEDDLVDMALTPSFKSSYIGNNAPTERISINTKSLIKEWKNYIKNDQLHKLYTEAVELLDHGNLRESNQNCLTRHFVESIARSILNHEDHRKKAISAGLSDPKELLVSFLKIQVNTLSWAQSLDKRAFQIQQTNIPLFCQDVPVVQYK